MHTFNQLKSYCSHLNRFERLWFVAGGWAIDLALGKVTREHHDVDFCIFRDVLPNLLTNFADWTVEVCIPQTSQRIVCHSIADITPPRHELHFHKENWHLEFLLIERTPQQVIFRRDPTIKMDYHQFARYNKEGIPYVNPAWQLLFKAKNPRDKDHADFQKTIHLLSQNEAKWLRKSLKQHQPQSEWLKILME